MFVVYVYFLVVGCCCCLWFVVVCRSLFVARCLLFDVFRSLFAVLRCPLFVVCCLVVSMFVMCCLLLCVVR